MTMHPPKPFTPEWYEWDCARMEQERRDRGEPPFEAEFERIRAQADPDTMNAFDDIATVDSNKAGTARRLVLTPASAIKMRPVRWLWEARVPAGALVVPAGREGTGKSQFLIWLAAQITRGTLPGCCQGEPRPVIYCAAEDSWEQTIVPRLAAAGADTTMVFRIEVKVLDDDDLMLSLPADLPALEVVTIKKKVALIALDPMLSTIHASLDSHKNRDMRQVLDPLVKLADRTGASVAGLAHFNKSSTSDPSSAIAGSGAFKDVPRAVLTFARDDQTGERVMSQTKNNLGRDDLPSLSYEIESVNLPLDDGETAFVSKLTWTGESDRSVGDMLRDANTSPEERNALDDAERWITELLADGPVRSEAVFEAAKAAGHSERTLNRAKKKLKVISERITPEKDPPYWQWCSPAKTAKTAKTGTRSKVGKVGNLACERCGISATRLTPHHATGERICPSCCRDEYDDA